MKGKAETASRGSDSPELLDRPNRPAADIMGVLGTQKLRRCQNRGWEERMGVAHRGLDVVGREDSPYARQQPRQDARIGGRRAALEDIDMGVLVEQHRIARLSMDSDADLVGHGTGRHIDGVLLP